jgi:hypothetical protein
MLRFYKTGLDIEVSTFKKAKKWSNGHFILFSQTVSKRQNLTDFVFFKMAILDEIADEEINISNVV